MTLLFSARPYVKEKDLISRQLYNPTGKKKQTFWWVEAEAKQTRNQVYPFCKDGGINSMGMKGLGEQLSEGLEGINFFSSASGLG